MKTQLKYCTLTIAVIAILQSFALHAQFTKGNGNVIKSERKASGFNYIEVKDGIDLYLSQGSSTGLIVEADENLHEFLVTEVEGDVLKIYLKKNFVIRAKSLRVYLKITDLKGLEASGGSDVESNGTLKLNDFSALCSGGSDMRIAIEANELKFKASGGSDGFIKGKVKDFKGMASGGSDIKAFELETNDCEIEVSGGSDAEVNASGSLVARGSGGSDVLYKGSPSNIDSNMSGGSDLIHQ